jgi:uncharacterized Tic20 family protein
MDDQDRLEQTGAGNRPPVDRLTGDEPPRVVEVNGVPDDERDVVKEYEERYYGGSRRRLEAPPPDDSDPGSEVWGAPVRSRIPTKAKRKNAPAVSDNERKWASLAHGSTLLTALALIFTAGLGTLVIMLVPLLIYFSFRKRSEFVAFQALQAFTAQLIGTIGWLALLIVATIAAVVLTVVFAITIIGIPLIILVWLAWILLVVVSLLMPLGMVIYSVIALVETRSGRDYRMPRVARWVESQMYGSSFIEL